MNAPSVSSKTVYVVGAGASVCAGAPVIDGFKSRAQEVSKSTDVSLRKSCRTALTDAYLYWDDKVPTCNIEEFYILADLVSRLDTDGSVDPRPFQFLSSRVQYLIAKTLEVSLRGSPLDVHLDFVRAVWNRAGENGANAAVITLNWDILIDQAADGVVGRRRLNLGLDRVFDRDFNRVPSNRDGFALYKMHGSLNWWLCSACGGLRYKADEKDILEFWESATPPKCRAPDCPGHDAALGPLMTPPTSQKLESSDHAPITKRIWRAARKRLVHCEDLVVVGYSFPPTDIQFKMFILEALASNPTLRSILVVSRSKPAREKRKFESGYRKVFESIQDRVVPRFNYDGFEGWVGRGCPLGPS